MSRNVLEAPENPVMIPKLPPHVQAFYRQAEPDYDGFWEKAALDASKDVRWFRKWELVFDWQYPTFKWYVGGTTNICYNCVDHKIAQGKGDKLAFISESGDTGEKRSVTYRQLLEMVEQASAALRGIGVRKGDRVAVYLPMGIEAAVSMLACARIGAVHMVIFAGFSSGAIADRLDLAGAKFIITQAIGSRRGKPVPLKGIIDEALERLPDKAQVEKVVVLPRGGDVPMTKGRHISWDDFLAGGKGFSSTYVELESNEPLYILPTSGTTAKPKMTVHNHGGFQVYVYAMGKWIYRLRANDIWFATSDIGWAVGHSYCVYGPLLSGCTSILYDGTPDFPCNDMWWDIIERNKVTGVFTSPTGVRALMRAGVEPARKHDLNAVERIVVAGEVLNPAAWDWLQNQVFANRIPVLDHMWQTETGAAIVGNPYGLGMAPIKPGSATYPVPGVFLDIVSEKDGHSLGPNEKGVFVIRKPFPGLTASLWNDAERYRLDYWEKTPVTRGIYYAGDAAYRDEDGYIYFLGRADEVIKIAAHRIGTIEVENALVSHPAVAESAVTGVPDELRGEVASAFVVLGKAYSPSEELKQELIQHVKKTIGPIIVMKDIEFVNMLPKTRSGKLMRRVLKALLTNTKLGDLSTVEEEASITEIEEALRKVQRV